MPTPLAALLLATLPAAQELRPPSVPLVVHDPYFSIWSPHDRLTDGWPAHWTGRELRLGGLVTVDGEPLRWMGPEPAELPALAQRSLAVEPTTTHYVLGNAALRLDVRFVTPALPSDLDRLGRPLTYLVLEARSLDGAEHGLRCYLELSARVAVNEPDQLVEGRVVEGSEDLPCVALASVEQPVLAKRGDDLRIDWGTAYLAACDARAQAAYGPAEALRRAFLAAESLASVSAEPPRRRADDGWPAAALEFDLVAHPADVAGAAAPARAVALLAYDDEWSIQYFGDPLRPYWRRKGAGARALLSDARRDLEQGGVLSACADYDRRLMADLERLGGRHWAELCALAYRQCLGANKLCADANGRPLLFPKENFSNGCIATVDVIYPMAPLFLLLSSDLARAMLVPVLDYGSSRRWPFPFAPHDLGTYPHATGQVYGGGERSEENQMPVEESANLLLLLAALAEREGTADFAARYWPTLERWAAYLAEHGLDPVHQLCTDDFTGHLARNANLSLKATLALAAWARLCERRGLTESARAARATAEAWVPRWLELAGGAPSRLAFDRPDSWSQKYNLVWDDLLGLDLFPPSLKQAELAHYRTVQNAYGLPLDSRASFTKIDWTAWSACLTGERADFEALIEPLWRWADETPDRVPLCDWFETREPRKINMIARPVVGGLFLRALQERETWSRWFAAGARGEGEWAALPLLDYEPILPNALSGAFEWRWTTTAPAGDWTAPEYDDSTWRAAPGGFGTPGTPGAQIGTTWRSPDIWLRRHFVLEQAPAGRLELSIHHDEDAELYLDSLPAARLSGYTTAYVHVPLSPEARAALQAGPHVLAIHCHQTGGGQSIDAGIDRVTRAGPR